MGFFPESKLLKKQPLRLVPDCHSCGLYRGCKSPKMSVNGEGRRKVLILGEAPGGNEDEFGIPFCGRAGKYLEKALRQAGVDMHRDCWITNSLICRPGEHNDTPTPQQIDWCRPNLTRTLDELRPEIVIPLGAVAVRSLLESHWGHDTGAVGTWVGWQIPLQDRNCWVCPTYHPSYCIREADNPVLQMFFERHLREAFEREGRPWAVVPDYRKEISIIKDSTTAAVAIRTFTRNGGPAAVDFENNCLKPDRDGADIICCSIGNARHTITYLWTGEAIQATQEFLQSPVPKIASNLKHEDRWCQRVFGHPVNNWAWDTMLAAHWIDNRPGITGLKFQAFVNLGFSNYNEAIKPFLEAQDANSFNRIREEIDFDQLLLYCGYDSLLEYKVAKIQMERSGYGTLP